jgi:hypothetical protein
MNNTLAACEIIRSTPPNPHEQPDLSSADSADASDASQDGDEEP